jgi:hypothetical protein
MSQQDTQLFWVGGRDQLGMWQTATNLTRAQAERYAEILRIKDPQIEPIGPANPVAGHRYTALGFPSNDIMVTATNVTAKQARHLAHLTGMTRGYEFHPMHNIKNGVQARVHGSRLDRPGDHYYGEPYWKLNDANYTFALWYPPEDYPTRRAIRTGK